MDKNEHETLFLHCKTCLGDKMQLQISHEHGLVIMCIKCEEPVATFADGTELDNALHGAMEHGCEHCEEQAMQKPN